MARHQENCSILGDTDMSTTANSKAFRLENLDRVSVQAEWTGGTAAGSFSLQSSDDKGTDHGEPATPSITNWTTEAGSSVTVSGTTASPIRWNFDGLAARWIRVVWARTGGTGTITDVRVTGKGAG